MFDDLPGFIWIDGDVVPWSEAKVHVMTHALHYASSVFEGLRSYHGRLFKAREHYERFHRSAYYLDFKIPYQVQELITATEYLLHTGGYSNGYVRAIAWCGSKKMTVSNNDADVHVAIGVWEREIKYPNTHYTQGIRMKVAKWRKPDPKTMPVHSKASGLYVTSSMSKKEAEILNFDDALMLDYQGYIAEATSSNIFFIIDDVLCTPIPDCFLNGITRLTCIDIAKSLGVKVMETKLKLSDLDLSQEAFLTGTAIEVLPIGSIEDGEKIWSFKPGEVTSAIRSRLLSMACEI